MVLLIAYGLKMAQSKTKHSGSCFLAFDPSDYSEVDQYKDNPAFQSETARALLPVANKALIYFTRAGSEYEQDTKKRYSHVSARKQQKLDRAWDVAFPFFSMTAFQAFKRERSDFEEAAQFCLENLSDLNNKTFTAKTGYIYERHHILALYSLWKIDQAFQAIDNSEAAAAAQNVAEAYEALTTPEDVFNVEIKSLNNKKAISQKQARRGKKRHKGLEPYKDKALQLYDEGRWKSVNNAAGRIYDTIIEDYGETPLSEGECVKTISKWIKKHDPERKKIGG